MTSSDIRKENIEDVYPMSDIQKGLVYHSLKDSAGFVFINQVSFYFKDRDFNPQVLNKAVSLLVEKHPVLRTGFDMHSFKEPVQVVFKSVGLDVKNLDISALPVGEQEEYINDLLAEDKKNPFIVMDRPGLLWRMRTFTLDDENICFIFINHHAILDGWSFACFVTELNNLYFNLKSDPGFRPGQLRCSYKEYVIEEKSEKKKKEAAEFWKKEMAGFKRLDFPGVTGGGLENYESRYCVVDLGSEFLELLRGTANKYGTSIMNLCFGAYAFMLRILSPRNDMVVGLSINNRPACEDGDKILGCFINHLPVRIVIPPGITWREYIEEIDLKLNNLRKYQKLSFFEIVKALGEETRGRNPLFDTIFNFMDLHVYDRLDGSKEQKVNLGGLWGADLKLDITAAFNTLFSFHMSIYRGFSFNIQYYTAVFNEKLIKQLADCFGNVLRKFIYEPEDIVDANDVMVGMAGRDVPAGFENRFPALDHAQGIENKSGGVGDDPLLFTEKFIKQREYWLKILPGYVPGTSFPYDYPDESAAEGRNGIAAVNISRPVNRNVMSLSKGIDLSIYILLLTALKISIYLYTGSEDMVVISPVREQRVSDDTRGDFLFIRGQVKRDMTFKKLILRVREALSGAYENQDYPAGKLAAYLFDIPVEKVAGALSGVLCSLNTLHDKQDIDKLPGQVQFVFARDGEQLSGEIRYDAGFYTGDFIGQAAERFVRTLDILLDDIDGRISGKEFLSTAEKKRLVFEFNETGSEYPAGTLVHELLERQAENKPGAAALRFAGLHISYAELNNRSNVLAAELRKKGSRKDMVIGLMVEHSIEMIVGIFAALKAGAAYLPVDPAYPAERMNYMLKDSEIGILLTAKNLTNRVDFCGDRIYLDDEAIFVGKEKNPAAVKGSGDPVYIIYTSGTTGRPKGVMIEESGLVNYLWWAVKTYVKDEPAAFPLYTSLSFDLTVTSIYTPLISGNTVEIYRGDDRDILLEKVIRENRVGIIKLTPAHLEILKEIEIKPATLVKRLIVGGEKLAAELARDISGHFRHNVEIYNEYGPTETVVGCMIYRFDPGMSYPGSVPIGAPADNAKIYLLDKNRRPVPAGAVGEIFISGAGICRGYINAVEITSEKLEKDPFCPGLKMYKTGDIGKMRLDGNMEFLGRIDSQVKVRGYRVELREIENRLLSHEKIKEAVVILRQGKHDENYLCAYIVLKNPAGAALAGGELREYLGERIPLYMVPRYFITVERLPLTVNGKIDRKALPEPDETVLDSSAEYVSPGNEAEQLLVEVWEKVLGRDKIGVNENFYQIGGDSIKSIQVAARMHKAGYKIEIKDILTYPTIAGLAAVVEKTERIPEQSVKPGIIPLTPIQRWFFEKIVIDRHHYNQAVMLHRRAGFDEEFIRNAFRVIVEHHDALRIVCDMTGNDIIQENRGPGDRMFHLRIIDLPRQCDVEQEIKKEAGSLQGSIDLKSGPLVHLGLFRTGEGDYLLVAIHHLVIDGVSWRILLEDMETLCQQYKNKEKLELPLKTDSFKLWSERLSAYADSIDFLKEKPYWKQLESGKKSPAEKDTQWAGKIMDAKVLSFSLNKKETEQLLTKVNNAYNTEINDILLTGMGLGLREFLESEKLLIALESHGREDILSGLDISRTVGWFTGLYPVKLDFSCRGDMSRQIKEVKEALHRVPHKGIGYGILRYLTDKKHKEEMCLDLSPRISFNYLGQFDSDVKGREAFEISSLSTGTMVSPRIVRSYELDIQGMIFDGRLSISIIYNSGQYEEEAVSSLVERCKESLRLVISHCLSQKEAEITPCDLTFNGLSIDYLDRLKAEYPVEDIYLCSPMQSGMVFHSLAYENPAVYFAQISYRFQGELDISIVEQSLNHLLQRYDILRTMFIYEGVDTPLQLVLKYRKIDFIYEDLRGGKNREIYVKSFKEKDRLKGFHLTKDVLMRVAIFHVNDNDFRFVWSFHHIVMDGWCLGILVSEFIEIYNSFLNKRECRLPEAKQYRTFIKWLETSDQERSREYWRRYLTGYKKTAGISVLGTGEAGGGGSISNQVERFAIEEEKQERLNDLAKQNNLTLNTLIQGIWGILLGKYNFSNDVVFGSVVSGRPPDLEGVESLVGLFINTIPVRIRYEEKTRVSELFRDVQARSIEGETHHYITLAEIQSESMLKQSLIDHVIIFENYPLVDRLEGVSDIEGMDQNKRELDIEISETELDWQSSYDFNMIVLPAEELHIELEYNPQVYTRASILRIGEHFKQLVSQIIENPRVYIDELTILTDEEKKEWLEKIKKEKGLRGRKVSPGIEKTNMNVEFDL